MNRVALSFLAHPDDSEILCGGTLSRLSQLGWHIHIATATAGDCGTMDRTAREISEMRVAEATAAASLIGAKYHCLHELDGFVVYAKDALRKVIDLFRQIAPGLVFAHAPRDYMMDHEQASMLARAASFIYAAPNASSLPVQPGSGIPYLYYCDPLDGIGPLGEPIEPTTVLNITDQEPMKLKMLACHNSQREWLRAHHGMDEYLDAVRRNGRKRGALINTGSAEAFVQHRGHAYPSDDLLQQIWSGRHC
jgi:LmbE family N-acetylglucosaminyl deacetylase